MNISESNKNYLLNKTILRGYQASDRGGDIECELDEKNQRVLLRGYAVTIIQDRFQQDNLLK